MHSIAVFGGTFDPVHNGHIQTSLAIQHYFNFDDYRFLPCKVPAIKPPTVANTEQRIIMLELAIQDHQQFVLDLSEIERASPSYMVDTLEHLREQNKQSSLTLIIGFDAFLSLPKWYRWERIIELAHLVIINRTVYTDDALSSSLLDLLENYQVFNKKLLLTQKQELFISSTQETTLSLLQT
jgi:nicotinate-nucleotide adenylyltransferase